MVILAANDTMDTESLEHALAIAEYEPQRIVKKAKRKTSRSDSLNSDSTVPISENAALPDVDNTYYEVPRSPQPKKLQQNFKLVRETQKSPDTESKLKPTATGYLYPVAGPAKVTRQRYSKDRPSRNPETTDSKLENILPGDSKGPTSVIAPSIEDSNSAKTPRRTKTRKRLAEKGWNRLDAARSQDTANSYVGDPPTTRGATKYRRLASLVKYDAAHRSVSPKTNRESGSDNLPHESTAPGGNRWANNGNSRTNASRSNDGESNGGDLRTTDPIRSPPGLNRKLHGRNDNRRSSAEQIRVSSSPPVPAVRQKSLEYTETVTERTLVPYRIQPSSEETNLSGDERLERKSLQHGYINDLKDLPVTPGLDVYQNIKAPGVVVYAVSPVSTTELPSTPTNPYSASLVFYPTRTPGQRYQVSTEDSWISPGKLNRERDWSSGEMKTEGGVTDVVAEATNLGSDEDESKDQRRAEVHVILDEGHPSKSGDSVEDRQEYLKDERNGLTDDKHNQYDDNKHQQGKDDVEHGGDSLHQPTQENQRHQKDGGGGGGNSKFEKGEGAEHMEGHHASEGEEGKKVYKSWHDHEEANKGHSDKERQSNHFDEKDGKQKEHEEEGGYHQHHEGGEKSAKEAEFDEKGEHQKGYNTKGQHSVHKKDEYEKRTEFFDEFDEDGEEEEDGEYHREYKHAKGGHEKVSHHKEGDHEEKYGKEEKHEKGKMHHEDKGHKISEGRDTHYDHDEMHGKKEKHEGGKKWDYKKGDEGNAGGKDEKSD
ncbi:uncharacterized protein LOC128893485 [Hylaeus anthracinus]|uniref:uncharacterized protein LOC128893485 n=1 Tax=Hylaeus anthracinus TaxID=313031 RepID=UPI0023B99454|nr:uncharacterized protein LOC128893485 [Hylaeus anthracinus]